MSTILDLTKKYRGKISPLDLDILISHAIEKPREFILAHPEHAISKKQIAAISRLIARRTKSEPIAYILGRKEFFGLDFKVSENTLVPRPETEMLVDKTLQKLQEARNKKQKTIIIDVGTGSGNIIISIAHNKKREEKIKFYGIDVSKKALEVAKKNAEIHNVNKKIKFLHGNLLNPIIENLKLKIKNSTMIIAANLPYLDLEWKNLLTDTETKGLKYEPGIALYSGEDGLDSYRELADQIQRIKSQTKSITVICEIGHLQKKEMKNIFSFAKKIEFKKDLSGKWRICVVEI